MVFQDRALRVPRRAFTIVELLVAIAAIAVLIALLMTGVQAMRAQAMTAECVNNLQQIGLAMQRYRSNEEQTPKAYHLFSKLAPVMKMSENSFKCPATESPISYGANFCLERFQSSDNKIVVVDAVDIAVPFVGTSDAAFRNTVADRHKGMLNALYLDGSVKRFRIDDVNPYDTARGPANVVEFWEPERKSCESCSISDGFLGNYWSNPNWEGQGVTRKESTMHLPYGGPMFFSVPYDIPLPTQTHNMSARFWGRIKSPRTDIYTFHVAVDNNAWFYLNGKQMLVRKTGGGACAVFEATAPVPMVAGVWNDFEVRVQNPDGGSPSHISLKWSTPSDAGPVVIPSESFGMPIN